MLTRAGFRDNTTFSHTLRQQCLANRVVDFMGTCMQKIFPFEIDFCPTKLFRQPFGKIQSRWTSGKLLQLVRQLRLKRWVNLRSIIIFAELFQGSHQSLRHVATAEVSEAPFAIRQRFLVDHFSSDTAHKLRNHSARDRWKQSKSRGQKTRRGNRTIKAQLSF